ncbi:menaquinone biosynthetic enzyme MqnA/MqnD family protein [Nocardia sp. NPDC056000]|uniref:menaquinone biosynthetic enzyme MqnA/MqnD family protein n=1 Tax=Nocardia sp. NPDC056000 TaxID=3345674 RepID=UPI0035DAE813
MAEKPLSETAVKQFRPRVGHIEYLNCTPLLWGLARNGSLLDMELIKGTPDVLATAIIEGRIDVGPVSLIEFLQHRDELVALPDIAIGSDGPVMSCIIVSRLPLDQLDGARVALGSQSRTSIRLARLLLEQLVGVEADYFWCAPDLDAMLAVAPAAVLIGDAALHAATYETERLGITVHDLGQMWREWTGHPFVFAVMAARRDFADAHPAAVAEVHEALIDARDLALREIEELSHRIARWCQFDASVLHRYYTEALSYDLGARQQAGIDAFADHVGLAAQSDVDPVVRSLRRTP